MKRILYILSALSVLAGVLSCEKPYNDYYPSLYYYNSDGDQVCRMYQNYTLNNNPESTSNTELPFSKPICVYYSGHWTVELETEIDWGFLTKTGDTGVHYFDFRYTQNTSGETRNAVLLIRCDNGEECEINLTQESL